MYKIRIIAILLITNSLYCQTIPEISRSTISVVGNTTMTSDGYYVSQSVGQLSIIGFSEVMDNTIIQGFQQPSGLRIIDASIVKETLQVYPVPVSNVLNLLFSLSMEGSFDIEVFDYSGRLVLNQKLTITDYSSNISLAHLASATYILKIITNNATFYETIIKH